MTPRGPGVVIFWRITLPECTRPDAYSVRLDGGNRTTAIFAAREVTANDAALHPTRRAPASRASASTPSSALARVGRFALGRWMVTPGARAALPGPTILKCFERHENGDFGDLSNEDFDTNLDAIAEGHRILSAYQCDDKQGQKIKIYVITEADRSVTTLLLEEEY
jgi:hypothetical protein